MPNRKAEEMQLYLLPSTLRLHNQREASLKAKGGTHTTHPILVPTNLAREVHCASRLPFVTLVRGVSDDAVNPHGNQTDNEV